MDHLTNDKFPSYLRVDTRLQNAHKSTNGLFPNEIILLLHAEQRYYSTNIPGNSSLFRYWDEEHGITSLETALTELCNRGFLKLGDLEYTLDHITMDRIKNLLREKKLPVSGNKGTLIQRLISSIPAEELLLYYPDRYFQLTDLGQEELANNQHLIDAFKARSPFLNYWEANRLAQNGHTLNVLESLIEKTNNKLQWAYNNRNFSEAIDALCEQSRLYIGDNDYSNAIITMGKCLYFVANGIQEYENRYNNHIPLSFFKKGALRDNWRVLEKIQTIKAKTGYSSPELEAALCAWSMPINLDYELFTKQECAQLSILEIEENYMAIDDIYNNAKEKALKEYPDLLYDDSSRFSGGRATQRTLLTPKEKQQIAMKNELLLSSFDLLKDDIRANEEELASILKELVDSQPDTVEELWQYLLETNLKKVKAGKGYDSISYSLTTNIIYELTKANYFVGFIPYFLNNELLLKANYLYTPDLSEAAAGIIGYAIREKDFEKATTMLTYMLQNKKNDFTRTERKSYQSYSYLFEKIINYILKSDVFSGESWGNSPCKGDEEVFNFLKYWVEQIPDTKEIARINVNLVRLL